MSNTREKISASLKVIFGLAAMAVGLYLVHPGFLLALGGYIMYQMGDAEANLLAMTETLNEVAETFRGKE